MFSALDEVSNRRLKVTEQTPTGKRDIPLIPEELNLEKALVLPTREVHTSFLRYLACQTTLVSDKAYRLDLTFYKLDFERNRVRPIVVSEVEIDPRDCS